MSSTPPFQRQDTAINKPTHRASCEHCLRAQKSCICDLVQSLDNATEVLIFQHPLEKKNAKGTARLLCLCLQKCKIVVGETFDSAELKKLLNDSFDNLLLYPEVPLSPQPHPQRSADKPKRLILLDGTWRKSRKLLHCNPLLAALPRLALSDNIEGQYHIRKAHKDGQLSTLEACSLALQQLENIDTTPLQKSFTEFVDRQIQQAQQGRAISGTISR